MKQISLTQGKFAIVDDCNYEWLNQWKWYAVKSLNTYYAGRCLYLGGGRKNAKRKSIFMHNLILKPEQGQEIDHCNRIGLDNRLNNLRSCTHSQNCQNATPHKKSRSKYKGVTWLKARNRWVADITVSYKMMRIGSFHSEILAAKAYDKAARKYHGEFACLNFPI